MPLVTVKYLTIFSNLTGKREEKVKLQEGSTLKDLAGLLYRKYGRDFEEHAKQAMFLVNGRQAEMNERLSHGDVVVISYPVGGGAWTT
ncbi:MAG: molybdopterin synthase sulfur carrier subunit [Thermoprotei archaeon]|nr:MAG: molybdopterin synthase sulfur carrier subunit [Thermoprotei archaeon]